MKRINTYKTSEIAKIIGIHPNTVRLYEELKLIPAPERLTNGYRIFNDFHIQQFRLARTALKVEVLQNGLRKKVIDIIKISATRNFDESIQLAECYLLQIKMEQKNAEEAIEIAKQILSGAARKENVAHLTRKETADLLEISMDTLRNWEMNGLLMVKRRDNGYRVYTDEDILMLKMIRSLRCANYSLSAIMRMMAALSGNPEADIKEVINTPQEDEDIVSVYDKLLTSLHYAELNAHDMLAQLQNMKKKFKINPPL